MLKFNFFLVLYPGNMPNWSFFAFHLKLSFSELIPRNFICPWVFLFEVLSLHCAFPWILCNFLGSSTTGSGLGRSHPEGTWPGEPHPDTTVQARSPFLPDARGSGAKTCPSHDRLTSWAPLRWPGTLQILHIQAVFLLGDTTTKRGAAGITHPSEQASWLESQPLTCLICLLPKCPIITTLLKWYLSYMTNMKIWHIFKDKTKWECKGARSPLFVRFKSHQKLIFQNYFLLNVNVKVMNEIIRHFWKYNTYYFLMTLSEVITIVYSVCVYVCVWLCVWCWICVYVFTYDVVCVYMYTFHISAILVSHKKKKRCHAFQIK